MHDNKHWVGLLLLQCDSHDEFDGRANIVMLISLRYFLFGAKFKFNLLSVKLTRRKKAYNLPV